MARRSAGHPVGAFLISAPGSMWLSVSTWKPLHTPSTMPPLSAWALTSFMMADWLAMAPQRK